MDLNLSGKRAVVCGGSAGIGRACAVELAALGASVVVAARSAEKLAAVVAALPRVAPGQTHAAWAVDLSDAAAASAGLARLVEGSGPVHILVNNTGGPPAGRVVDLGVEAFRAGFESLLATPHALTRVVLPGMKAAGYGRVVNIASTSVKQPIPNLAVSNAIRAATANWAKTLSQEVAAWGVTVNNVLPGYTDTERLAEIFEMRAKKAGTGVEEAKRAVIADIPAGRLGRAEEIAAAVAFLASPAAGYVSGINLPVDGGRLAGL
jgi:3-oxoacyl-[acyl-carrier protein] reductase